MKKLTAILLALALTAVLSAPALAAGAALDLSGVTVTTQSPDGVGRLVPGDEELPRLMYARILISYQRPDGTTWTQSMVVQVDLDYEFVMPSVQNAQDSVLGVAVVVQDVRDNSPGWRGHEICPPAAVPAA